MDFFDEMMSKSLKKVEEGLQKYTIEEMAEKCAEEIMTLLGDDRDDKC